MRKIKILLLIYILTQSCFSQSLPEPILRDGFPKVLSEGVSVPGINSANFYDFDNDGKLEIVIATARCLYIIKNNGEYLNGWPRCFTGEYIPPSTGPAIGDVDGDGGKEIVFLTMYDKNNQRIGSLHVINYRGNSLNGFPVVLSVSAGYFNGPVLYDINGDGNLEIFIRGGYQIFGYNYKGELLDGWPRSATIGNIISGPRISDIDFDGEPEIFAASALKPHIDSLKRFAVYAWNTKGELKPGWPFVRDNRYFDNAYLGAIARYPQDSIGVIVFASTRYPPIDIYEVYALDARAELLPGWPKQLIFAYYWLSGIVLMDFYREKLPEVVVMGDLAGYFYSWDMSGAILPRFPMRMGQVGPVFYGDVTTVPIVYHDIENKEFIMFSGTSITYNDSGYLVAMRSDSSYLPWSPLKIRGITRSSPGFADLEGDGNVEMVLYTEDSREKKQYLYVYEFPGIPYDRRRFPWPVTNANRWNTGEFGFEPTDTLVVAVRNEKGNPTETKLYPNYPNPFNVSTKIRYELKSDGKVKLSVYNTLGQHLMTIVNANQRAGTYEAIWDARKYPSGVYYAKLETEGYVGIQKLLFIK